MSESAGTRTGATETPARAGGCRGGAGSHTERPHDGASQTKDGSPAGHGGHLLHMAPMLVIFLAPTIGWKWTGILLFAMLGLFLLVVGRRRVGRRRSGT